MRLLPRITLLISYLLLSVCLVACRTDTSETMKFKMVVPKGSPQLATIFLQHQSRYQIDYVNGSDPLVAAFLSQTADAIIAPTNLGAKLFHNQVPYQLAAVIGFGNLYLVSQSKLDSLEDLTDKEVFLFGQNQTSDIILKYLLEYYQISCTLIYYDSVQSLQAPFLLDPSRIILSAEPTLSALLESITDLNVLDLQTLYQNASQNQSYPQASLFLRNGLTDAEKRTILQDFEANMNQIKTNLDLAVSKAMEAQFGLSESVLRSAIQNSHLDFVLASTMKSEIEAYFTLIFHQNPQLISNPRMDPSFYYEP